MRSPLRYPLALVALAGCSGPPDPIVVRDAYVRLPAVAGRPAAAYFTLEGGDVADRLVAISTPLAARIELHASMTQHGMTTMTALDGIDIPANDTVAFSPAGDHAMLFDMPATLAAGGRLPLKFQFRSGVALIAQARAIAAGAPAP